MPNPLGYFKTCIILAMFPNLCFAAPDIQPGRWAITSTLEMPGMAFSMPASKQVQCITADQILPQVQQENNKC